MKALTVRHQWALALALGIKPVENRSRPLGRAQIGQRVAIHASKAVPEDARRTFRDLVVSDLWQPMPGLDSDAEVFAEMDRTAGCVLAVGLLTQVVERGETFSANRSPWRTADRFGLVFADVVRLREPVPARGMLGLWTLPPDVQRAVDEQLAKEAK